MPIWPVYGASALGVAANPGGAALLTVHSATKTIRLRRLTMVQMAGATAAGFMQFSIIRLSAAPTGGTAASTWQNNPSAPASTATCLILPTLGGFSAAGGQSAMPLVQTLPATVPHWERNWSDSEVSPPISNVNTGGFGIRINATGAVAGATLAVEMEWEEYLQ